MWSVAQKYVCFKIKGPTGSTVEKVEDAYVDNTTLIYVAQRNREGEQ